LSYRDIQHLTIRGAVPFRLDEANEWDKTAAGRVYSYKYAYGRLDSYKTVQEARKWTPVGPHVSIQSAVIVSGQPIPHGPEGLKSSTNITREQVDRVSLVRTEHVTVTVWLEHQYRGDIDLWIVSPAGIRSHIAPRRTYDSASVGFQNWTFLTVKHWEEDPIGEWTLHVTDTTRPDKTGVLKSWYVTVWGEGVEGNRPMGTNTSNFRPKGSPNLQPSLSNPSIIGWDLTTVAVTLGSLLTLSVFILTWLICRGTLRLPRVFSNVNSRLRYAVIDPVEVEEAFTDSPAMPMTNLRLNQSRMASSRTRPSSGLSGVDMGVSHGLFQAVEGK
jgi:subtilisin-like proprotein convertase family protein